jgi:sugar/nucleoside kinase (ribokinase family)
MRVAAFGELCLHVSIGPESETGQGLGSGSARREVDLEVGGSAHYVAAQVVACGDDVLTVAAVGSDAAGGWIRQALTGWAAGRASVTLVETGHRTSRLVLDPAGHPGGLVMIADVADHATDVLAAHAPAAAGADYAHLSCFPGSDQLRLALAAAGTPIVADFGFLPWLHDCRALAAWTLPRLHGVSLAVFNGAICPDSMVDLARRAVLCGVQASIVTFGSSGAMACTANQEVRQPAVAVTAANPAGAGDTLVAAFLHGWHHGADLDQALERGQQAAARHVGSRPNARGAGAREGGTV